MAADAESYTGPDTTGKKSSFDWNEFADSALGVFQYAPGIISAAKGGAMPSGGGGGGYTAPTTPSTPDNKMWMWIGIVIAAIILIILLIIFLSKGKKSDNGKA